jgi:hypothetical protein
VSRAIGGLVIVAIFAVLLVLLLGKAYSIVTVSGVSTEMPSDDLLILFVAGLLVSGIIKGVMAGD